MISRRSFLKGAVALAGTTTFSKFAPAAEVDSLQLYDCIVIGAGPAGLTAARELSRFTVKGRRLKILVLEGSSRLGGRLFTDHSKVNDFGSPLELGAEYIHMAPGSAPIWNEIERYGLQIKSYPKICKGFLYNSEFLAPTPKPPLHYIARLNLKIIKAAGIFDDISSYQGRDISAARFMKLMDYDGFAAECAESILAGHLGVPLEQVSMKGFNSDHYVQQLSGDHEYYVMGGYDSIFRKMAKEITQHQSLLLNHPVAKIRSGNNQTIEAFVDRKSTRLNSSHTDISRMPSSA